MASAQYGQRGRSGTIDAHALHLWSGLADQPGGFLRILGLLGGNHDGGETAKGRRMGAAAAFRFCTVEAFAVIMTQRLDDGRRSEERRVGKEGVRTCRFRRSPSHTKKT